MNKMRTLFLSFIILSSTGLFAQVGINATGASPDPSAGLDINFNDKGFLPPRLTSVERDAISAPATGLMLFNTTTGCFEFYMGGSWQTMACGCSGPPSAPIAGGHLPSTNQIVWNWSSVVQADGYKWNTTNDYGTANDLGLATSYTQTGLSSCTPYSIYVWSYNPCGQSTSVELTATTTAGTGTMTFNYTGAQQTFTVPGCITQVTVDVYGAKGYETTLSVGYGGRGGQAKGTLNVSPGQTLYVYVGQDGNDGGWNGGEANTNAWGGGASDIRIGGTALTDRVVVAGGGGSAGNKDGCGNTPVYGGDGGPNVGDSGDNATGSTAGTGGTQSAGGTAGTGSAGPGQPGTFGYGGAGYNTTVGGGGGGWYGGGGGGYNTSCNSAGGGGGSNYVVGLNSVLENNGGVNAGDGYITISW